MNSYRIEQYLTFRKLYIEFKAVPGYEEEAEKNKRRMQSEFEALTWLEQAYVLKNK